MDIRGAERSIANAITMWAIRLGIPRPPYTRHNAMIIETRGRRSKRRRRIPVGYLESDGKFIVVAEDGARADWVRNARARDGRLRVFVHGSWRDACMALTDAEPEDYLKRMNSLHAALVRLHSTKPQVVEITPRPAIGRRN